MFCVVQKFDLFMFWICNCMVSFKFQMYNIHHNMTHDINDECEKQNERCCRHVCIYSRLHVECHSIKSSNLKFVTHVSQFVSHMSQFVSHMSQPIACGVSFNQILQSQVRESYVTVRGSYVTANCMWSVIQSNLPISIQLVSFQRNVAKET